MRFDASQHMKLGQQMKLAPRMIQSMEVLQMSLAELEERVEQELESNAALERVEGEAAGAEDPGAGEGGGDPAPVVDEGTGGVDAAPMDIDEKTGEKDFSRLETYAESNPEAVENEFSGERSRAEDDFTPSRSASSYDGERDGKMDAMSSAPARSASLTDQLLEQWALCEVESSLRPLGEQIIAFLDADGYLRTPLATIADRAAGEVAKAPPAEWERALLAVQLLLEPAGIAARDTRECLLLQLDALSEDPAWSENPSLPIARMLIESHLDDLLRNRLPKVSEKTNLTVEQIKDAMGLMRRLSLAPARRLVEEAPSTIVPDAIVEYDADSDRYIAYLNERRVPNLRVNQEYAMMAKDREVSKKDREFLKTSINNAAWLIDAINQRKHTLLRVIRVVVDAQREYFDYGPQALKPLPMTQVAEQLGVHVATVSRAVADKYILTPRGVVALRKFFTGGTQTDSGEDVSWDAIKAALQEVIDAEDKKKPLSDEALVDELKKKGIEIARRTVAKYRDQLGIPSARLRRAY